MYNVSVSNYGEEVHVRIFDNVVTRDAPKKSPLVDVPFDDGDAFNPKPLKGRDIGDDTFEYRAAECLRCSCSRSKSRVRQLALSMDAKWFATFTFSPDKVDRYDYDACWGIIKEYLSSLSSDVQYLIVCEMHKDGAFHFHALMSDGVPVTYAGRFNMGGSPRDVWHSSTYNWGFTSFTKVSSSIATALYISKYITKDMSSKVPAKQRYYYSRHNIKVVKKKNFLLSADDMRYFLSILPMFFCQKRRNSNERMQYQRTDYKFCHFTDAWIDSAFSSHLLDFLHSFCYSFESDDGCVCCY